MINWADKPVVIVSLLLVLLQKTVVGKSQASFLWSCEKHGDIFDGKNDGVTCNTYHQCFRDINSKKNSWVVKTFECPPGGIWDREFRVCMEGTDCGPGDIQQCEGGSTTHGPTPTPTEGPPPFSTTSTAKPGPGGDNCGSDLDLECRDGPTAPKDGWWQGRETEWFINYLPHFHGFPATTPIQNFTDGSYLIASVPITEEQNWWRPFVNCDRGCYLMGVSADWRVNRNGDTTIVSTEFICQRPGFIGKEQFSNYIVRHGPNKRGDNWKLCHGAAVGFQLTEAGSHGRVGQVEVICSTEAEIEDRVLPYGFRSLQNEARGNEPAHCAKYQAACGFQTAFSDEGDNEGLLNIKFKCCPLVDPLKDCVPKEERVKVRKCNDLKGTGGLRCDFVARMGLSVVAKDQADVNQLIFYSSIGYDIDSWREHVRSKFPKLMMTTKSPAPEYIWNVTDPKVGEEESVFPRAICLKPFEMVEIYQIVGRCGYLYVRTNRFVKVIKNAKGETASEEYFDL